MRTFLQRTFDTAGTVLSETDARGKTTTHRYDALNRLTQTTFDDGSEITYSYDTGTNNLGRLMQVTDPNGSTAWSYDSHGRITQRRQQLDGIQLTVNYGYDPQGRLIQLTYPSGKAVTFGYDPAGRINRVEADGETIVEQLSYHPLIGALQRNAVFRLRSAQKKNKGTQLGREHAQL